MLTSQRFKKMANVAERQIGTAGNHVTDVTAFFFSKSRKTITTTSTTTSTTSDTSVKTKTVNHPNNENSLMANTLLWAHLIPPMPLIASTTYRHYSKGPPAKSWSLSMDITIAIVRDFLARSSKITVEDIQKMSTTKKLPIPSNLKRQKFTVPNEYRKLSGDKLAKLFTKKDEERIGWNWQKDRDTASPIKGEWLQSKGNPLDPCKESTILYLHGGAYYLGCYGIYRQFLGKLIKYSKGRTCAIDYRLAPQHPFPAAVEDALATYLYLIDPPKDGESSPIDPKKIVIAGDSAGGGLTFALLIAIRDAGLPSPGGAMTLSPWLDLTHSLPSILSNIMTDYLPPAGFKHKPSPALDYAHLPQREEDLEMLEKAKAEADEKRNLETPDSNDGINDQRTSIGPFGECVPPSNMDDSDIHRVQFYADNHALKIPMVSPLFDKRHLRQLPRLLVQCGSAERLRDESIFAALEASNSYPGATDKDPKKGNPSNVILEMFTDQPHVFSLLFSNKTTSRAIKNMATFVRDVTNSPAVINNLKDKESKLSYISDDLLTIRNVSPEGVITDIKEEMLRQFSKEEWEEWENRLSRSSLKERMDEVSVAFEKFLKDDKPGYN